MEIMDMRRKTPRPDKKDSGMKPYWISISPLHSPSPLNLGIGVTALSEDDARTIVSALFGGEIVMLKVEPIQDMTTIDQKHVAPNMEPNWLLRGVWYPAGYRQISS